MRVTSDPVLWNIPQFLEIDLAALGPAAPYGAVDPFSQDLQYVLYDDRGSVRLTTLTQPPAYTTGLRESAARTGVVPSAAAAVHEAIEAVIHEVVSGEAEIGNDVDQTEIARLWERAAAITLESEPPDAS